MGGQEESPEFHELFRGPAGLDERTYSQLLAAAASLVRLAAGGKALTPTVLVHEAWIKLEEADTRKWNGVEHFKATAARAMRQILVDQARSLRSQKRGGDLGRMTLDTSLLVTQRPELDVEELDRALTDLEAHDERAAKVVQLRFFGGLTEEEIASQLGVSVRSVQGDWSHARAWLRKRIAKHDER